MWWIIIFFFVVIEMMMFVIWLFGNCLSLYVMRLDVGRVVFVVGMVNFVVFLVFVVIVFFEFFRKIVNEERLVYLNGDVEEFLL